ncbi:hypothetical protein AKJ09_00139 [Labilithrix luteola]|uniref:Uncharacterized protein n=1 Tax=Labilithrix luteola TaxID=1391654 RepID=A0A0K1PIX7_9BACT|nr:hypothetical protein AKJ09_00139 [Labilithrix luteola]
MGPVVLTAVAFAAIGPKLVGPHDKAAGAPFVYQPPAGFVERAPGSGSSSNTPIDMTGKTPPAPKPARPEGEREWTAPPTSTTTFVPTVTLDHSKTKSTVEEPDLATIEAGFPDMFAKEGISWTPVRRETHVRPGGERVGIIEGECTKKSIGEIAPGIAATLHYRRLILVFPDDAGSSIVTALYGYDEVAKWQPAFEASINQAQGVATRLPPAPSWLYAAWGAAGLVLGWLASALIGSRRSPEPAAQKDPT